MSFICPVPAQASAVRYLEDACTGREEKIVVCGHSKGGNLAMYAAAFCREDMQDRLAAVYNFDGPGFVPQVLASAAYQRICGRITTFVPQSSIVGMLLEHEEQYIIVHSGQKSQVMQHDPSSWAVERDHLYPLDHVTNSSRFIDHTLKSWLADMSAAQREKFVDVLYAVLAKTNVRTIREMDEKWFACGVSILSSLGEMDEETRKIITESLSLLLRDAKETIGKMGAPWISTD